MKVKSGFIKTQNRKLHTWQQLDLECLTLFRKGGAAVGGNIFW